MGWMDWTLETSSLPCLRADPGSWLGRQLGCQHDQHVASPWGLVWASSQCGGWIPRASVLREHGVCKRHFYGLSSEVTYLTSVLLVEEATKICQGPNGVDIDPTTH